MLLEALSYGLPVLASDIPANLDMGLDSECYFQMGDIDSLAAHLSSLAAAPQDDAAWVARRRWVMEQYDWERIARRTLEVYSRVLRAPKLIGRSVF